MYKPAAASFEGLIKDLVAKGYGPTSSGGYNYRNIRGGNELSQHAFGKAIDMNSLTNALGMQQSDIPDAANLAKKWGLEWGGTWKNRPDPMHFEYTGGAPSVDLTAQQQWVQQMWPLAVEQSKRTGIDPRVILSQSALETGWGKWAPNNNYFGVKGPGEGQKTLEMVNGRMQPTTASFRTYKDPAESFADYGNVLMGERYAGVRGAKGLDAQLAALGQSGYATDKDYATKLAAIAAQIPEGGFPQESNSPYSLRAGHPPNPTVGTGGYTAPGANTTPVSPAGAIPATDKYGKAAEAVAKGLGAFGGSGGAGPALGAGGRAPLLPATAPG